MTDRSVITEVSFMDVQYQKKAASYVTGRSFSSLSYRKKGQIFLEGRNRSFVAGPGNLTYVPKGCGYHTQILENGSMYVMHFDVMQANNDPPAAVTLPSPQLITQLFESAVRHYNAKGADLVCMSLAYQLLAEAHTAFTPVDCAPTPRIKKCKAYIDENIADPTLRISTLAALCGVSEVYFRKEFEKYYHASPLEYIKNRRIETAKLLLQTGLYSVTEVAFRTGFDNSCYFSSEFRRLVGMSPTEYIKQKVEIGD